jgi:hypothetical protein
MDLHCPGHNGSVSDGTLDRNIMQPVSVLCLNIYKSKLHMARLQMMNITLFTLGVKD